MDHRPGGKHALDHRRAAPAPGNLNLDRLDSRLDQRVDPQHSRASAAYNSNTTEHSRGGHQHEPYSTANNYYSTTSYPPARHDSVSGTEFVYGTATDSFKSSRLSGTFESSMMNPAATEFVPGGITRRPSANEREPIVRRTSELELVESVYNNNQGYNYNKGLGTSAHDDDGSYDPASRYESHVFPDPHAFATQLDDLEKSNEEGEWADRCLSGEWVTDREGCLSSTLYATAEDYALAGYDEDAVEAMEA